MPDLIPTDPTEPAPGVQPRPTTWPRPDVPDSTETIDGAAPPEAVQTLPITVYFSPDEVRRIDRYAEARPNAGRLLFLHGVIMAVVEKWEDEQVGGTGA